MTRFWLPPDTRSQLHLTEEARQKYADPQLLPAAKKARLVHSFGDEVLRSRIAARDEPLPTLCSSYTSQHTLDSVHLANKGIFAALEVCGDDYMFLSPLTFVSLFGTTGTIVIPSNVHDAFHGLGNAIAQPHALLAWAVALRAVCQHSDPPEQLIRAAWQQRLTSLNAVVHRKDDWLKVQKLEAFVKALDFRFFFLPQPEEKYILVRTCLRASGCSRVTHVPERSTLLDAIRLILQFDEVNFDDITFDHALGPLIREEELLSCIDPLRVIRCFWKSQLVATLAQGPESGVSHLVEEIVSPTQPFEPQDPNAPAVITCNDQVYMSLTAHPCFLQAITFMEMCHKASKDLNRTSCCAIAWEEPPLLFAIHVPPDDHVSFVQTQLDAIRNVSFQVFVSPVRLGDIADGDLIFVRPCAANEDVLVILETLPPTACYHVKAIPRTIAEQTKFVTRHGTFQLQQQNRRPIIDQCVQCHTGDLLTLVPDTSPAVVAGGHPTREDGAHLARGANFAQRLAFASTTNGWAASDELFAGLNYLQQHAPQYATSVGLQRWDPKFGDFNDDLYGETHFASEGRTLLLLQVQAHWALIETVQSASNVSVHVFGLPHDLAVRAAHITCRLVDISPQRATIELDLSVLDDNMCGWCLLYRLFRAVGLHDRLPDSLSRAQGLNPHHIEAAVASVLASQRDWHRYTQDADLKSFAFRVRLNFLIDLAVVESQTGMLTDIPLNLHPVPLPTVPAAASTTYIPDPPLFRDSRSVHCQTLQTQPVDRVLGRLVATTPHPGWMFSDTLDFALDFLRLVAPRAFFAPPCQWHDATRDITFFDGLVSKIDSYEVAFVFALVGQHWILCEFRRQVWDFVVIVHRPSVLSALDEPLGHAIAEQVLSGDCVVHVQAVDFHAPDNLCGWALMFVLFRRFGTLLPAPSTELLATLRMHPLAPWFQWIQVQARAQWTSSDENVVRFAAQLLVLHFHQIIQNRIPSDFAAGGAVMPGQPAAPSTASPASAIDPLTVHDPWARTKQQPSKWEDLQLPKAHPFLDEKGNQLLQLHRLQATSLNGGIIMTTRQYVPDLFRLNTKQPLVLLLPQLDDHTKATLGVTAHGPFEVILFDKAVNQSYKRITHAVPVVGKFEFRLKDPACEFTITSVSELVLELDSRLCSKQEFDQAKASPIAFFRDFLLAQAPALKDSLTVYGFRHNRHPASTRADDQIQIIAKVPTSTRPTLMQQSGHDGVLIRDYLERGAMSSDITVVPKFWEINVRMLREIQITIAQVVGVAGITMTRRGLAVRAWARNVADVRRLLLPADPRLTDSNIAVVPKHMYEASGWPTGAAAADVVEAVNKAVGLPPVPTRQYRQAGVHVWQLGFAAEPKVDTFTVKVNSDVFQILLSPSVAGEKGHGKGKAPRKKGSRSSPKDDKTTTPSVPVPTAAESKRIEVLEARFDSLQSQVSSIETKQSSLEGKIDERFVEISSTLRQLVQLSQGGRSHEPTGETPPAKWAKNS